MTTTVSDTALDRLRQQDASVPEAAATLGIAERTCVPAHTL